MWLNPALRRYPKEAAIVGHLVLSYGELELIITKALGAALGNEPVAMRTMFRLIGERNRIEAADALMREGYCAFGLEGQYGTAIGAMKQCTKIRNQYAHCHWGDQDGAGLFFTDLQDPARSATTFDYWWRHVDVPLLEQQAGYFDFAAEAMQFIHVELVLRQGKSQSHPFLMPKGQKPPPLHNPPEKHIPPWLDEDGKRQHLVHAEG